MKLLTSFVRYADACALASYRGLLSGSCESNLSTLAREESASCQALADAMALRALLLDELPSIQSAVLRCFRASPTQAPEAIIFGTITREEPRVLRIASPVMRARLCGFQFELENGFLKPMKSDGLSPPDDRPAE